jgi:hypothetical protein
MMTDHFIEKDELGQLDMSDNAKSALYFDCHAHCLLALHMLFKTSIAGEKSWATMDFFLSSVSGSFADADKRGHLSEGSTAHYIVPRFMSLGHSFHTHEADDVFAPSIAHVIEQDLQANLEADGSSSSLADDDLIRVFLSKTVESFHFAASRMFTFRN